MSQSIMNPGHGAESNTEAVQQSGHSVDDSASISELTGQKTTPASATGNAQILATSSEQSELDGKIVSTPDVSVVNALRTEIVESGPQDMKSMFADFLASPIDGNVAQSWADEAEQHEVAESLEIVSRDLLSEDCVVSQSAMFDARGKLPLPKWLETLSEKFPDVTSAEVACFRQAVCNLPAARREAAERAMELYKADGKTNFIAAAMPRGAAGHKVRAKVSKAGPPGAGTVAVIKAAQAALDMPHDADASSAVAVGINSGCDADSVVSKVKEVAGLQAPVTRRERRDKLEEAASGGRVVQLNRPRNWPDDESLAKISTLGTRVRVVAGSCAPYTGVIASKIKGLEGQYNRAVGVRPDDPEVARALEALANPESMKKAKATGRSPYFMSMLHYVVVDTVVEKVATSLGVKAEKLAAGKLSEKTLQFEPVVKLTQEEKKQVDEMLKRSRDRLAGRAAVAAPVAPDTDVSVSIGVEPGAVKVSEQHEARVGRIKAKMAAGRTDSGAGSERAIEKHEEVSPPVVAGNSSAISNGEGIGLMVDSVSGELYGAGGQSVEPEPVCDTHINSPAQPVGVEREGESVELSQPGGDDRAEEERGSDTSASTVDMGDDVQWDALLGAIAEFEASMNAVERAFVRVAEERDKIRKADVATQVYRSSGSSVAVQAVIGSDNDRWSERLGLGIRARAARRRHRQALLGKQDEGRKSFAARMCEVWGSLIRMVNGNIAASTVLWNLVAKANSIRTSGKSMIITCDKRPEMGENKFAVEIRLKVYGSIASDEGCFYQDIRVKASDSTFAAAKEVASSRVIRMLLQSDVFDLDSDYTVLALALHAVDRASKRDALKMIGSVALDLRSFDAEEIAGDMWRSVFDDPPLRAWWPQALLTLVDAALCDDRGRIEIELLMSGVEPNPGPFMTDTVSVFGAARVMQGADSYDNQQRIIFPLVDDDTDGVHLRELGSHDIRVYVHAPSGDGKSKLFIWRAMLTTVANGDLTMPGAVGQRLFSWHWKKAAGDATNKRNCHGFMTVDRFASGCGDGLVAGRQTDVENPRGDHYTTRVTRRSKLMTYTTGSSGDVASAVMTTSDCTGRSSQGDTLVLGGGSISILDGWLNDAGKVELPNGDVLRRLKMGRASMVPVVVVEFGVLDVATETPVIGDPLSGSMVVTATIIPKMMITSELYSLTRRVVDRDVDNSYPERSISTSVDGVVTVAGSVAVSGDVSVAQPVAVVNTIPLTVSAGSTPLEITAAANIPVSIEGSVQVDVISDSLSVMVMNDELRVVNQDVVRTAESAPTRRLGNSMLLSRAGRSAQENDEANKRMHAMFGNIEDSFSTMRESDRIERLISLRQDGGDNRFAVLSVLDGDDWSERDSQTNEPASDAGVDDGDSGTVLSLMLDGSDIASAKFERRYRKLDVKETAGVTLRVVKSVVAWQDSRIRQMGNIRLNSTLPAAPDEGILKDGKPNLQESHTASCTEGVATEGSATNAVTRSEASEQVAARNKEKKGQGSSDAKDHSARKLGRVTDRVCKWVKEVAQQNGESTAFVLAVWLKESTATLPWKLHVARALRGTWGLDDDMLIHDSCLTDWVSKTYNWLGNWYNKVDWAAAAEYNSYSIWNNYPLWHDESAWNAARQRLRNSEQHAYNGNGTSSGAGRQVSELLGLSGNISLARSAEGPSSLRTAYEAEQSTENARAGVIPMPVHRFQIVNGDSAVCTPVGHDLEGCGWTALNVLDAGNNNSALMSALFNPSGAAGARSRDYILDPIAMMPMLVGEGYNAAVTKLSRSAVFSVAPTRMTNPMDPISNVPRAQTDLSINGLHLSAFRDYLVAISEVDGIYNPFEVYLSMLSYLHMRHVYQFGGQNVPHLRRFLSSPNYTLNVSDMAWCAAPNMDYTAQRDAAFTAVGAIAPAPPPVIDLGYTLSGGVAGVAAARMAPLQQSVDRAFHVDSAQQVASGGGADVCSVWDGNVSAARSLVFINSADARVVTGFEGWERLSLPLWLYQSGWTFDDIPKRIAMYMAVMQPCIATVLSETDTTLAAGNTGRHLFMYNTSALRIGRPKNFIVLIPTTSGDSVGREDDRVTITITTGTRGVIHPTTTISYAAGAVINAGTALQTNVANATVIDAITFIRSHLEDITYRDWKMFTERMMLHLGHEEVADQAWDCIRYATFTYPIQRRLARPAVGGGAVNIEAAVNLARRAQSAIAETDDGNNNGNRVYNSYDRMMQDLSFLPAGSTGDKLYFPRTVHTLVGAVVSGVLSMDDAGQKSKMPTELIKENTDQQALLLWISDAVIVANALAIHATGLAPAQLMRSHESPYNRTDKLGPMAARRSGFGQFKDFGTALYADRFGQTVQAGLLCKGFARFRKCLYDVPVPDIPFHACRGYPQSGETRSVLRIPAAGAAAVVANRSNLLYDIGGGAVATWAANSMDRRPYKLALNVCAVAGGVGAAVGTMVSFADSRFEFVGRATLRAMGADVPLVDPGPSGNRWYVGLAQDIYDYTSHVPNFNSLLARVHPDAEGEYATKSFVTLQSILRSGEINLDIWRASEAIGAQIDFTVATRSGVIASVAGPAAAADRAAGMAGSTDMLFAGSYVGVGGGYLVLPALQHGGYNLLLSCNLPAVDSNMRWLYVLGTEAQTRLVLGLNTVYKAVTFADHPLKSVRPVVSGRRETRVVDVTTMFDEPTVEVGQSKSGADGPSTNANAKSKTDEEVAKGKDVTQVNISGTSGPPPANDIDDNDGNEESPN